MEKAFISYRRQSSWSYVRALYDRLSRHFGDHKVFMDLDDIPLGMDFVDVLDHNLRDCKAMLVVIDTKWLDIRDAQGNRRLDNPHDFVRLEVATALQRNIPVIPILIDGTPMPTEAALPDDLQLLPRRQALELNSRNYDHSVRDLIRALERHIGTPQRSAPPPPLTASASSPPATPKPAWYKRPLLLIPLLLLAGFVVLLSLPASDPPTPDNHARSNTQQSAPATTNTTALPNAGFDCTAARSHTEKAICTHPLSRSSDAQLQKTYSQILNLLPPDFRNDFRKEQQTWLRERDATIKAYCLNQSGQAQDQCITDVYQQRLNALQALKSRQFIQALVIDPPSNIRYKPNGSVRCQATSVIPIPIVRRPVKHDSGQWYWTNHCGQHSWGVIHESQIRL